MAKIEIPKKLVFFEGCTTSRVLKETRLATYILLEKAKSMGIIEEYKTIPNERCCGYASMMIGDFQGQRENLLYNIQQITKLGIKDVLFTCGACTHFMGDHPEFVKRGLRPINILEFLYALAKNSDLKKLIDRKLPNGTIISGHYSCHLRRLSNLKMEEMYREVAKALGAKYKEMENATDCCGIGSEGDVAMKIALKKIKNAEKANATIVPLACAGCELMLTTVAKREGSKVLFPSFSSLIVSCFNDLDSWVEKIAKKL